MAMEGSQFTTRVRSQADLLRSFARAALLRQCRYPARQGSQQIQGVYAPSIIREAFSNIGAWSETRASAEWVGRCEITSQSTLAGLLDFQVNQEHASLARPLSHVVCIFWHANRPCSRLHLFGVHADCFRAIAYSVHVCLVHAHVLFLQSVPSCTMAQRANGSMAVSTRGDGWAWVACPSRPFVLQYKATRETCRLRVTGCIVRFADGKTRYPEGPRPPPQEDEAIVSELTAQYQAAFSAMKRSAPRNPGHGTKTKTASKAKRKREDPWPPSSELKCGVHGEYVGGIFLRYKAR